MINVAFTLRFLFPLDFVPPHSVNQCILKIRTSLSESRIVRGTTVQFLHSKKREKVEYAWCYLRGNTVSSALLGENPLVFDLEVSSSILRFRSLVFNPVLPPTPCAPVVLSGRLGPSSLQVAPRWCCRSYFCCFILQHSSFTVHLLEPYWNHLDSFFILSL